MRTTTILFVRFAGKLSRCLTAPLMIEPSTYLSWDIKKFTIDWNSLEFAQLATSKKNRLPL
jgi:hypothetical protein